MARKTKKKAKSKPLDLRSKMYLVVALCSLMLLVSVAVSFVLVGGLKPLGGEDAADAASESMVAESGYDKDRNTIDDAQYETTILPLEEYGTKVQLEKHGGSYRIYEPEINCVYVCRSVWDNGVIEHAWIVMEE